MLCLGTEAYSKKRKMKRNQEEGEDSSVKHANLSTPECGHNSTGKPGQGKAACTTPGRQARPGGTETRKRHKNDSWSDAEEAVLNTHLARESEHGVAQHEQHTEPKSITGNAIDDEEATKRTIFIGNVPADTKKAALKAVFLKYVHYFLRTSAAIIQTCCSYTCNAVLHVGMAQ